MSASPLKNIDSRVWLVMGAAFAFSIITFAFRAVTSQDCSGLMIKLEKADQSSYVFAGKEISFSINKNDPDAKWIFGDGKDQATGSKVKHTFFKTGVFTIQVTLKGGCKLFENVVVKMPPVLTQIDTSIGGISGPYDVAAGSLAKFSSLLTGNSYKWTVLGGVSYGEKNTKDVSYSFSTPGNYTIQLVMNGDPAKTFTQLLHVSAPEVGDVLSTPVAAPIDAAIKPTPTVIKEKDADKPVEKKYTNITDAEMKYMIGELIEDKKSIPDFSQYLCSPASTKVIANGKAMTLVDFLSKMKDKKGLLGLGGKRKIQSVKQSYDPDNGNCVVLLTIEYK